MSILITNKYSVVCLFENNVASNCLDLCFTVKPFLIVERDYIISSHVFLHNLKQ